MDTLILIENLGIGGIERSAIRIGESLKNKGFNIELNYINKFSKFASSKKITIKKYNSNINVNWLIIHIDNGKYLKNLKLPKANRTSIISHFPRIDFLPKFTDLWTISYYNAFLLSKKYKNIKLIYNPVSDIFLKKKKHSNLHKKNIGRISRNDIAKIDFDSLIALCLLSRKNYKLKLVGIPSPLKIILKILGHKKNITFIDELVNEEEISDFYKDLNLLVHGSFAGETFGMVITEALASRVPVIYSANYRKGLAPHELINENYLCSGFWNIYKKSVFVLENDNSYDYKITNQYLSADYNSYILINDLSLPVEFDYENLIEFKSKKYFFNLYILITNYLLKSWYSLLKIFQDTGKKF